MMMNLFSTFDPCTGKFSMNWISTMMFIFTIPNNFEKKKLNQNLMNKISEKLNDEIKMNTNYKSIKLMLMSMILLILTNNMLGILLYVFTSTSQINFSLSLSLPMWISYMFGWKKKTKLMLTNMLPKNTPSMIMPLMIVIEFSSNLIRPSSLAIRLSAYISWAFTNKIISSKKNFSHYDYNYSDNIRNSSGCNSIMCFCNFNNSML